MTYLEQPPSPLLQRYVEAFWQLEAPLSTARPTQEKILPDGCIEIIFNLADRFERFHANGVIERQPSVLVVGQMRQHVCIAPTGGVRLFAIRFKPSGAFPFLRVPLHELTDRILSAETVQRDFTRELEERLHSVRSFAESIRQAEIVLARHMQFEADRAVELLAERIVASQGRLSVVRLAQDVGLSTRQLERRFQTRVGISPKSLARIIRFQKIFKAVEQNADNWSNVALSCGYYDQAHLIHDFKAFSGENPSSFLLEQTAMSAHLTRKNRMSFFYKTKP